jgi:hypothetical protein
MGMRKHPVLAWLAGSIRKKWTIYGNLDYKYAPSKSNSLAKAE